MRYDTLWDSAGGDEERVYIWAVPFIITAALDRES